MLKINKNLLFLIQLTIANKNYEIKIFFAGGSIITLISEAVEVVMYDLGTAWNVKHTPKHKI